MALSFYPICTLVFRLIPNFLAASLEEAERVRDVLIEEVYLPTQTLHKQFHMELFAWLHTAMSLLVFMMVLLLDEAQNKTELRELINSEIAPKEFVAQASLLTEVRSPKTEKLLTRYEYLSEMTSWFTEIYLRSVE